MGDAFRKIIKDANDILDKYDKWIFFLALAQQFILLIILLLDSQIPIYTAYRVLRCSQEIILLSCFFKLMIEKDQQLKLIDKLFTILYVIIFASFFIVIIVFGFDTPYECNQKIWIIYSGTSFFVSTIELYIGCQLLCIINSYWKEQQNVIYDGLQKITMDELSNRTVQITILILASIISSSSMFYWDYRGLKIESQLLCIITISENQFIVSLILLILQFILPSIAIYYVYYIKNRNYFHTNGGDYQRDIVNLCDDRSSIPLLDM
ncbi:hypothetical protein pb186bvf_001398 [Paramecium bursaria]